MKHLMLRAFGRAIDMRAHLKRRQQCMWKRKSYHTRFAGSRGSCNSAECRLSHRHRAVRAHVDALLAADPEAAAWFKRLARKRGAPAVMPDDRPTACAVFARLMKFYPEHSRKRTLTVTPMFPPAGFFDNPPDDVIVLEPNKVFTLQRDMHVSRIIPATGAYIACNGFKLIIQDASGLFESGALGARPKPERRDV